MPRKRMKTSAQGRSNIGAALRDSAVKKFGTNNVNTADQFINAIHGIPITNNIPLQYLLGVDVIPLERCWSIVGSWGSWKSAFGWYIVKLFCEAGGIVMFLDTEHKTNPDQVLSILQNNSFLEEDYVITYPIVNLDDMLRKLVFLSNHYMESDPDEMYPMLLFVDSIGGVTGEEAVEGMKKSGQVDMGYTAARGANSITQQMKGFVPNYLAKHNIAMITVNHQKVKIDSNRSSFMPKETSEAGGVHKDFANTWIIQLKGIGDKSTKSYSLVNVRMSTKKSSLSKAGMWFDVPVYTYPEDFDEGLPMKTVFDWDTALVHLLTREKTTFTQAKLDAIADVRVSGQKAWCSKLGIKSKEPISLAEMGKLLHSKPEVVEGLQNILGIKRKRQFESFDETGE